MQILASRNHYCPYIHEWGKQHTPQGVDCETVFVDIYLIELGTCFAAPSQDLWDVLLNSPNLFTLHMCVAQKISNSDWPTLEITHCPTKSSLILGCNVTSSMTSRKIRTLRRTVWKKRKDKKPFFGLDMISTRTLRQIVWKKRKDKHPFFGLDMISTSCYIYEVVSMWELWKENKKDDQECWRVGLMVLNLSEHYKFTKVPCKILDKIGYLM